MTTSLDDIFPHFEDIENYPAQPAPSKTIDELARNGEVALKPGVYDFYLQGFCLDPGKHGPSSNPTYLIAPLKGKRSSVVKNLLKNSTKHPDISQHEIQTLVWAVSSGTKYGEMSRELQLIADKLLTEEELKSLGKSFLDKFPKPIRNLLWRGIKKKLPEEILCLLDTGEEIKTKVADAKTTYEELERIAIKLGVAPIPADMQKIEAGGWSLVHGSGQFFMRVFPSSYSCSRVQIYVPERKSKLKEWAEAIKEYEGWFEPGSDYPNGSRSYRNNNPGNLKYTDYTQKLGASGKDKDGFAVFDSYEAGLRALQTLLSDAATGKLKAYKPEMSLLEFFETYAPAKDKNKPKDYAKYVAKELKICTDKPIKELIADGEKPPPQIIFDPCNYVAVPINTNEQRLKFRGMPCK